MKWTLAMFMAAALAALSLVAGCGETVGTTPASPEESNGGTSTTDSGQDTEQIVYGTLIIQISGLSDGECADITVLELEPTAIVAEPRPIEWCQDDSDPMELPEISVPVGTLCRVTIKVPGYLDWTNDVRINPDTRTLPVEPVPDVPAVDPCSENEEGVDYYEIEDYLWTDTDSLVRFEELRVAPEGDTCALYEDDGYRRSPEDYRYSGGDILEFFYGRAGWSTLRGTPR